VGIRASPVKYLTETFDACAAALEAMLAHEALWYTFTHMAHHRGQAEVYLRLKNVTPPAWRF